MCGIVVGLSFGKLNENQEDIRQKVLRYLTTELFIATEERGKDASGAAVLFDDGKYFGLKRGERVTDYLAVFGETKLYYGSLLKLWRANNAYGKVYLGHCRAGTTGDNKDNNNNHPIKIGNLVGIHNGVIKNHDEIFEKLGCERDGEVDSEAIFRLFEHFTDKCKEPFTMDMIQEVVNRLEGQFAVCLFNADNINQIPVFRDGRPLEIILIKSYGIVLILSDNKFWERVHFRYERLAYYYREMLNIKLPSFLDKGVIETKTLVDDSAFIFDLSTEITNKTKIDDLGEWKKISRTGKIWQSKRVAGSNYNNNYNNRYNNRSSNINKDDKDKKRRVFDRITKRFVVKVGDKILDENKSVLMEVDDTNNETKALVPLTEIEKSKKLDKNNFEIDTEKEESSKAAKLTDYTSYNNDSDENTVPPTNSAEDVIDGNPEDINVVTAGSEDFAQIESEVQEIELEQYSADIREAAEKAYDDLASTEKGYADLDDLLTDTEIKDNETAEQLGLLVVSNKVHKAAWKDGFMACLANNSEDITNIKSKRREYHIVNLKAAIILLAEFYRSSKGANESTVFDKMVKQRLASIALNFNRKLEVQKMLNLFNTHEKQKLREITEVISQADKYKKAGESK